MCDIADGQNDIWRSEWVKARKEHTCCACREIIRKGDRYRNSAALYDGSWSWWKHCARCWMLVCELQDQIRDYDVVVDMRLNCGEEYEGPPDDPMHAFAFMTRDDAQEAIAAEATS